MKKTFTLLAILIAISFSGYAQVNCALLNDSVIEGAGLSDTRSYFYNDANQIVKIQHYYASNEDYRYDTLKYSNGLLDSVINYYLWEGQANVNERVGFTYNNDNQISRITIQGDAGNGLYTMAHDVIYDGQGNLTDIILDEESISGQAEGFSASFRNIEWTNGNVTYAELVADLGGKAIDTLELSLTFDNKKNLEKHFIIDEAPDLIMHNCVNNLDEMTFINDEGMGNAGTVAMSYEYTYNEYDEVATRVEFPGVFNSDSLVLELHYDCPIGLDDMTSSDLNVSIYPIPVHDQLNVKIDNASNKTEYEICGIDGKLFNKGFFNEGTNSINVAHLNTGIYFIKVYSETENAIHKFIKQ
ncbi:MAG: T9SS type A sorting domain-containing protein [Salinivirgaceae bacterium]|jgi:hypothetical protein|nr:T9SS type A sorting domain-containing protein [Salinivirgaceae bacterium]